MLMWVCGLELMLDGDSSAFCFKGGIFPCHVISYMRVCVTFLSFPSLLYSSKFSLSCLAASWTWPVVSQPYHFFFIDSNMMISEQENKHPHKKWFIIVKFMAISVMKVRFVLKPWVLWETWDTTQLKFDWAYQPCDSMCVCMHIIKIW